jgi:ABC-2 type transport system permease protein
MMLLNLVKKDFLLTKKYAVVMLLVAVGIPLFILWRAPVFTGFVSFLFTIYFTEFLLCQSISLIEAKYPKADALLCAAPYSRGSIVKAKYAFFLLIFVLCYLVYSMVALIVPSVGTLNFSTILLGLLFCTIPYGIYMPFQLKLGYEKTKYAFMIILFALAFGTPVTYMANVKINLRVWTAIPAIVQCVVLAAAVIVILGISLMISVRIYTKKEL